ncbi:MAG: hypothetical protein ACEQSA_05370, partial [Weeksellaceae bacterium]
DLLRAAFTRTKDRILPYFWTMIISIVMQVALIIGLGLLAGLNALIWMMTQSVPVTGITAFISVLVAIVVGTYVNAWTSLAIIYSLISPHKLKPGEIFTAMKPLIVRYYWVMGLVGLFFIGLLPFGLITLFIVILVWVIWGAFTVYTVIEYKDQHLGSLWRSKAIVSTRFWAVLLRLIIIYGGFYLIMMVLGMSQESTNSPVVGAIVFILSILSGPFLMSYSYETYRNLEHPETYGKNTVWKALSIIGLILVMAGITFGMNYAVQNIPSMIEQIENERLFEQGGAEPDIYQQEIPTDMTEEELQKMLKEFEAKTT